MAKLTRLKDVRQRKALTQQQLADRAGVNRVTIARIETGRDEPFPTTLRKVADALGVEPEELLEPAREAATSMPANGPAATPPLDPRITVMDPENVARLLQAEPDLLPLVNEAAEQLSMYLPESRLRLEYVVDPEYGEPEQLFLGAWTDLDPYVAMDALNEFDRAWGIPNAGRSQGLLIVDLR
ncbi:MAG: helix-turn-helix transcriptional regulator [Chloroflexota bacterium]